MLQSLSIRDVVLIDRLDLDFRPGLGVLTGETGAGKSILLDALGLALGARAESGLVRQGASLASVTASFDMPRDHPVRTLLNDHGLPEGEPLILRRTLAADGRSRAFVNDQPVGVAFLRQLGAALVEIQGQLEQRGLLDSATHREALDAFGAHGPLLRRVGAAFEAWREAQAAEQRFKDELAAAQRDEAFLRHAAEELARLDPQDEEEGRLAGERIFLAHREQVMEAVNGALALLGGEADRAESLEQRARAARRQLERAAEKAGGRLDEALAALDRALLELGEATQALQIFGGGLESEPGRLEAVEDRLYALRDLARKHQGSVEALPALRRNLEARLAAIEERGPGAADHARRVAEARALYEAAARELGQARSEAGRKLDQAMASELAPLKLDRARFATRLEPLPEADWSATGSERVAFEVSTIPGVPLGPIAKIASGGELARFMLALKVVLARIGSAPTLVFDEVDSGIGGATADAVGERLSRLGRELQVLVVTHSPQVAARGACHWRVTKSEAGRGASLRILTKVEELPPPARREEIARMLSGRKITDEARAAADMLIGRGAA
jgi:DNA repair protein RecN (Recombination protein N)